MGGIVLVTALLQVVWVGWRADRSAVPDARWIWANPPPAVDDRVADAPMLEAFLVVRDVEIDRSDLESGPSTLEIVADETYRFWVNGIGPGTGAYRLDRPADLWDVSRALVVGPNRVVVEVRSDRGAGGLLGELRVGSRAWPTDGSWRIVRRWSDGLLAGWAEWVDPAGEGRGAGTVVAERPRIWGKADTGRWRVAPGGGDRVARRLPSAPSLTSPLARAVRARHPAADDDEWLDLRGERVDPWSFPRLGPEVLWDFGEEIEGIFALELATDDPALLYLGTEPPQARDHRPRILIPVAGAGRWEAVHPERFRYALVVGAEAVSAPEVLVVRPEDRLLPALEAGAPEGIFGLQPPRERSRAEELVWRRVRTRNARQSSAGGTGSNESTP